MRNTFAALSILVLALPCHGALDVSQSVNQLIPDGDSSGLASTVNISGQTGSVADVTVNLDINGFWNGDLYAYLVHGNGFAVLLNRVGSTSSDIYGYGDSGMNVTFSDNAANGNIHYYQNIMPTSNRCSLSLYNLTRPIHMLTLLNRLNLRYK